MCVVIAEQQEVCCAAGQLADLKKSKVLGNAEINWLNNERFRVAETAVAV